ncbi:hypothetical protein AU825_25135, partial [Salmonella enterica subsp. salamae]|nr:hypothetical protein [Salmonella enterica subsp. salamae]
QDITLTGNSANRAGIALANISLNATNGSISATGSSTNGNGVEFFGNNTLTAQQISVNGTSAYQNFDREEGGTNEPYGGRGVSIDGSITFTGDTTITGKGGSGAGVGITGISSLNFINSNAEINASNTGVKEDNYTGALAFIQFSDAMTDSTLNFGLQNSNLSINANSTYGAGMSGWNSAINKEDDNYNTTVSLSGTGNVIINATSQENHGFKNISINASGLNGTAALNGTSTNGSGVNLNDSHMTNVTVSGSS